MNIFNDPPIEGRSCGACTACCTIMGVKQRLNKPNYVPCQHIVQIGGGEGGCEIYENRPGPCREFSCAWRSGHFGNEESRPDKLGMMFSVVERQMGNFYCVLTGWGITESVLKDEKIKYLLTRIGKIRPLIIRTATTISIFGKRNEIEKIEKQLSKENERKESSL